MQREILAQFQLGDVLVRYPHDPATGVVGLEMFPVGKQSDVVTPRATLRGEPFIDALPGDDGWPARPVESLLQFKLAGDEYPGAFVQGHSMRNSGSIGRFRFLSQDCRDGDGGKAIETWLAEPSGLRARHRLEWRECDGAMTVSCRFENGSEREVALEMFASFSLAGITPFDSADACGRLRVHRFRSVWSAEARHECRALEDLHLERSWSGAGAFSERFGQVGTMSVRKWFPFVAVEDVDAGVLWGAMLGWAGSWQMEIFRQHDDVAISGGLADREFGHWMMRVPPGGHLDAPQAVMACVAGDLDDLCDRLTAMQESAVESHPEVEHDLPVVFNEWCTTWGDPSHENLCAIAEKLENSGVTYLVIDAGWYKSEESDWSSGHGDWVPSAKLFPGGLRATADAIRSRGLIPGLWFEMETVGSQSRAFQAGEHLLMRDGVPVTVRQRRFWDLCDHRAMAYLEEKVIGLLDQGGFGYLKVDYNETAGIGCDHDDSLGEGLRLQVEGAYGFFKRIRERLPDLVVENCSSGGHRLEPSMLGMTAMSSFSDAHELVEIPIIAANLHRLMLPRQNQIWAVLHPSDDRRRLIYSLAATFLGRMCLSGGVRDLPEESWHRVLEAIRLYRRAAPIIKSGRSRRHGEMGSSWRHPRGWQAVLRTSDGAAMWVFHAFGQAPDELVLPFSGGWELEESMGDMTWELEQGQLRIRPEGDFSAGVLLFKPA
ncbi:MAG: alpha-galactosidase [Akkermansiaceae bacterium]|jgi:alpha-galactosidase|nr:alpha-galactosidase [Akkermansiaceae bacterium]